MLRNMDITEDQLTKEYEDMIKIEKPSTMEINYLGKIQKANKVNEDLKKINNWLLIGAIEQDEFEYDDLLQQLNIIDE